MVMDCKISLIVPTYNIENEITRCVESILGQTYHNIEIILVNDGSTDGTLNVLQELSQRDPRFRYRMTLSRPEKRQTGGSICRDSVSFRPRKEPARP